MRLAPALCLALSFAAIPAARAAVSLEEAQAELRDGHTDKAIELLRAVIAKHPTEAEAGMLLGEVLLSAERFDESAETLQSTIARNPSAPGLLRVLGDLRYRQGAFTEAEQEYKAAIKLDPKNARAIYGISRVYEVSCLRKKADEMLRVAHAIDFHDPAIVNAFESADWRSPAAMARMEKELAATKPPKEGGDTSRARMLKMRIAIAKALDGNAGFDLAAPPANYKIPLIPLMNGRSATGVGVPIEIGSVRAQIRFDTGASGLVLESKLAERAGVQRLADTVIRGIGNDTPSKGWIGYAPSVVVGGVEFRHCIVEVREKGSIDDSGGLIGSDIFERFLVTLDFHAKSVDLNPLPGPAWDGVIPVDRYDGPELAGFTPMLILRHYLLIPTLIGEGAKGKQTPGLFLLDTGAGLNMISTALAPDITKVHNADRVRVRGLSGEVTNVYQADRVVLQFAGYRQRNLDLTSFDLKSESRSAEAEISGIMGLPVILLFESITLDYRDGRIKFVYKP